MATVSVTSIENYPALLMSWENLVSDIDVVRAFRTITQHLEASVQPLDIVVDLTTRPDMPIGTTMKEALFGPYRNSKTNEWLIIGRHSGGKIIDRILGGTTERRNVRWFTDHESAYAYLAKKHQELAY